jgi:hypothetical protein
MKRDMELMRRMLFAVEGAPAGIPLRSEDMGITDVLQEVLGEHAVLLTEAGLIELAGSSHDTARATPRSFKVLRLTWAGHEYLDTVRNDTIWVETKNSITKRGMDLTFELVKVVGAQIIKHHMGLSPG